MLFFNVFQSFLQHGAKYAKFQNKEGLGKNKRGGGGGSGKSM